MSIAVRIIQSHDAAGEPASVTFVQPIRPEKFGQTWPDAVMGFIRELNPSRTSRKGVYEYQDPERGSGRLYVEGANPVQVLRIDELVHMEEIERRIGMRDPNPQGDIKPYLVPFVLKTRNPYVQISLGLCWLAASVAVVVSLYTTVKDASPAVSLLLLGMATLVTALSTLLCVRGLKRLKWWHAARAQAKRDGGPMPEDIQVLG